MRLPLTRSRLGLLALVIIQLSCAVAMSYDMLTSLLRIPTRPMNWELRELVDIGATLGLLAGSLIGAHALWQVVRQRNLAEGRLRRASADFHALMTERFDEWDLTPAERDVTLFALKGLSLAEIAALRETTEGTVKTQTNAIYRKAGVTGRPQLLSVFIEDLLIGDGLPAAPAATEGLRDTAPVAETAAPAKPSLT